MGLSLSDATYRKTVAVHTLDALARDLGRGDVTTRALFSKPVRARAGVIARQAGLFAGGEEARWFLQQLRKRGWDIVARFPLRDGQSFKSHATLVTLSGDGRDILKVERTLLNFLQRMCSIATYTNRLRKKLPRGVRLAATRKTLWGILDKKAVLVGGGDPHRLGLFDAVLVKDNHLKLFKAFPKLRRGLIEVETMSDALTVAALCAHHKQCGLLLDNFSLPRLRKAVHTLRKRYGRRFFLEASGGITEKNLALYAKTGVNRVSLSAITLTPPPLDLSLVVVAPL